MIRALLNTQNLASGLRAMSMLMKFILIFYLASKLSLKDFGIFNLFMAGIQLASALIPLDVYSVSIRKLLKNEENILGRHFGFLIISIVIFLPLSTAIMYYSSDNISLYISVIFFLLCPLEVFFVEFTRLFPALKKPFLPSFLLFFKNSLLTIPTIFFFETKLINPSLIAVFVIWFFSSFLPLLIGWLYIKKSMKDSKLSFNMRWSLDAIKLSFYFFLATILFRAILGVDKFIVENVLGIESLAVYSLYFSIAFASVSLVEAGVSSWNYPKLVSIVNNGDVYKTKVFIKSYFIKNMISSTFFIIPIAIIFPILASYNLDSIYSINLNSFYVISISVWIFCLSIPFHYYIYSLEKDEVFIYIYLISFVCYVIFGLFFLREMQLFGAAIMISIALTTIAVLRILYSVKKLNMHNSKSYNLN